MATLSIRIDPSQAADGARVVQRSLEDVKNAARDVEQSTQRVGNTVGEVRRGADGVRVVQRSLDDMKRSADGADRSASAMGRTFDHLRSRVVALGAAIGAAFSVREFVNLADTWSDIRARVGIAIGDMDGADAVMNRLAGTARMTYSALDQTANGFARNAMVLNELGKSTQQQLDYQEALNNALVVSGARGQAATMVQESLSRAMAMGAMRGVELNNVLNYGGRIAELLAEHFDTTTGGLMKLAREGKITGAVIYDVLIRNMETLREESESMPATIGDAMQIVRNSILQLVGVYDQANNLSESLAERIIWVADNLGVFARAATVAGTALLVAFAPTLLSQIAFGLGYIGAAGVAAMRAITVAVMANPLGFLAVAISTALVALYQFRDEIRSVMGEDLFNIVKTAANFLINSFKAAFEDLKFVFSNFPTIIEAAVIGAANSVIRGVNSMVQAAASRIDILINAANKIPGVDIAPIGEVGGFKELANPAGGRLSGAMGGEIEPGTGRVSGHIGRIQDIMATDNFASSASDAAESARTAEDAINDMNAAMGGAGAASDKATREAKRLAEAYDRIVSSGQEFIAQQELEARVLGMSEQAANALRYEFGMLNDARAAGITLNEADRAGFRALAEAMAEAEERTRALTERFEFMKDLTTGFFNDFRQNLISNLSEGMSFWEAMWRAMGDAAVRAIDRIVDKLMNDLMDALFQVNNPSGGGGFLSGLLGMFGIGGRSPAASAAISSGSWGLYDTGGWTGSGPASQAAGIVHGQEFVVRAGPAAQHRQLLEAINSGRAPAANSNAPAPANGNQKVEININVSGARGNREIEQMVASGVRQGFDEFRHGPMQDDMASFLADPAVR